VNDYTSYSLRDLRAIVPENGRQHEAIRTAIAYLEYRQLDAIDRANGVNAYKLAENACKLDSLSHLAQWAMNAYRHSVECLPYTYTETTRPFEHEGYDPDLPYSAIHEAYSALYHAADQQADALFNALFARFGRRELSWDGMKNTPEYREYTAIRESTSAWYKLMGFPGYWQNWQLKRTDK